MTPSDPLSGATADGSGALRWAIFSQFASYVKGMADGRILLEDGVVAAAHDAFEFPLVALRERADGVVYSFRGAVRFVGHGGLLNLPIRELEIHVGSTRASVEISDPDDSAIRLVFASGPVDADGPAIRIEPVLEEDGTELFFYKYPRGLTLDPIEITLPKGQGCT
jgi:hypothetical protein